MDTYQSWLINDLQTSDKVKRFCAIGKASLTVYMPQQTFALQIYALSFYLLTAYAGGTNAKAGFRHSLYTVSR